MSLVLVIASREKAFLMCDGFLVNQDTGDVMREDFCKIFPLQNGDRVAMTGGPWCLALASSLQTLPECVPTWVVANAIKEHAKVQTERAHICLVGRNGDALHFQDAELVHQLVGDSFQPVWNFINDDFSESRLRVVWLGWKDERVSPMFDWRANQGQLSFDDAVAEGREIFKISHRSFPGKVGGKIFEDYMSVKQTLLASALLLGSALSGCDAIPGAQVVHSLTIGFVTGFSAGVYSQDTIQNIPGCGVLAGDHISISPIGPLASGWSGLTWAAYVTGTDTFHVVIGNPSGAAVPVTAQQDFTIRFWH